MNEWKGKYGVTRVENGHGGRVVWLGLRTEDGVWFLRTPVQMAKAASKSVVS